MKTFEKEIGDVVYKFLSPPVMKSIPLCTRAGVIIGPVIGSLLGKATNIKDLLSFSTALDKVDPEILHKIMMDAWGMSKLECGEGPLSTEMLFEKHFGEHPENVYPVLSWILWETIHPFFPNAGIFAQKMKGEKVPATGDEEQPFQMPGPKNGG